MFRSVVVVALVLGADPGGKKKEKDALKDVVKGAVSSSTGRRDGGIDVSSLPFTPAAIQQVVLSYEPQIRACYEAYLATLDKPVPGTLDTAFVITPDGLVKDAKVFKKRSTLKDPKLHECVAAVLSTMEFPRPLDGADQPIEFPFNLQPQE